MIVQPEIRCVEFVDELTDWMEGALGDDHRALIEEHLSICPHCTRYLDQLRAAIGTLRVVEPTAPRVVLRDAVLAALRDRRD